MVLFTQVILKTVLSRCKYITYYLFITIFYWCTFATFAVSSLSFGLNMFQFYVLILICHLWTFAFQFCRQNEISHLALVLLVPGLNTSVWKRIVVGLNRLFEWLLEWSILKFFWLGKRLVVSCKYALIIDALFSKCKIRGRIWCNTLSFMVRNIHIKVEGLIQIHLL